MAAKNLTSKQHMDRGIGIVLIGLSANVILGAAKIIGGIVGNSHALIADGIESTLDIFSSILVLGGMKLSTLPADEDHPYGHGKAETLAAMSSALILAIAGVVIAIKGIIELRHPHEISGLLTFIILVSVIGIKEIMFRWVFSIGESANSLSIKTEAWHHRSDAMTSVAALIGITIAMIGGKGYESADDWAALAAGGIIIFNGVTMLRHSFKEIMDYAPDPETEETLRNIAQKIDGVVAIEKCRVRKSGINLFVDIHVQVNGDMTVYQGHEISHQVKDALVKSPLGVADVSVHIEPALTSSQGH